MGAAAYSAYTNGVFQLPYFNKKSGTIKLNILRELVIGGVVALIVDVALPISLLVGATGPTIMAVLNNSVIPSIGAVVDAIAKRRLGNRDDDNGPA